MNHSFDQNGAGLPNGENNATAAPFPNEGRLLVVDDEESLRITTAAILEKEGYLVDTAASGDEAISLFEGVDYDLVLTDLHMEGGDGLTVLSEVRRRSPLTISVVLTGFASVESAIAALQEGAYDYLVKPCDIDNMRHTIRRGVEHRRLMLAEQKARADLEQLNRDLELRIAERTSELTRLNEELADANQAKDVFLATLSHELRTPLTPVVGWVKLLRSGNLDSRGVGQALDAIERNAWLQSRLIDDLLDTSRIATGKLHFEPQPTDLNIAARSAVDTVRASAASRKIDLKTSFFASPLVVLGEPVRLQQIAWNLISNAIKFSENGGTVSVITDRDGSTSRVHGGLGLGLAIANALARMHGGSLEAHSEGTGHGSRFTLSIGLAREVSVPSEPALEQSHSLLGLDVLIVEDSSDTLALLNTIFTQEGAQVTAVTSARDALSAVANKRPALIISDIGMPDTDGYDFMQE